MESKKINQLATNVAPLSTDLTIIGDPSTGVSKKVTLSQIAAIFAGAVDFYANLAAFPASGTLNTIYCAKDTQKLYLWSGSAYVEVFPSQAVLNTYQLLSAKGVANGYASLDSAGKVPIAQLPSSIMEYKGLWSAATNTPTLANGTGDTGDVYICSAAGSVNFGAGAITFAVGDYVIYSGSIWQRSSGAVGTVTSVGLSTNGNSITIGSSPVTTSGTISFNFNGTNLQYVNGAGNLTTFPTLTGYVPYTGATQDVDLGAFKLNAQSLHIKGTAGNGHLGLKHQSASATASANEVSLFADTLGDLSWLNGNLYLSKFITSGNTAARSYTFPNATGTVVLTSDLSSYVPYTGATANVNLANYSLTSSRINIPKNGVSAGLLNFTPSTQGAFSTETSIIALGDASLGFGFNPAAGTKSFLLTANNITVGALRTFDLPNASGTIALTSDIPTNPVGGTGTANYISKFTAASTIGNSNIYDNGTNVVFGGTGVTTANPTVVMQNRLGTVLSVAGFNWAGTTTDNNSVNSLMIIGGYLNTSAQTVATATTASGMQFYNGGFYWYGNSGLTIGSVYTNTQNMFLTVGGNLIIGSGADAGYKLDVNGTGRFSGALTGTSATFTSGTTGPSTGITSIGDITAARTSTTGAIFLGTTGSKYLYYDGTKYLLNASPLEVGGSVTATGLIATTADPSIIVNQTTQTNNSGFKFQTNGSEIAKITAQGQNGNMNFNIGPSVGWGGYMTFQTDTTERMRITSGGNVAIGTSSPASRLTIQAPASTNPDTGGLSFKLSNNTTYLTIGVNGTSGDGSILAGAGGGITFHTNSDMATTNERMRITSTGNVEIASGSIKTGTTSYGRGAIKLGIRNAGTAVGLGGYMAIEIDGTTYFINLFTTTP